MKTKLLVATGTLLMAGAAFFLAPTINSDSVYTPRSESEDAFDAREWAGAAEYYQAVRANPETGEIDPADISKALNAIKDGRKRAGDPLGLVWNFRGPDNIGGRTRAILVDKDNSDRLWVGSVSGGLFTSDNKAGTWGPHPDFLNSDTTSSIIGSLAQSPTTGKVWVGSGSSFDATAQGGILFPGRGIAISDATGNNFEYLASTAQATPNSIGATWHAVNRIAFNSNGRAYACTHRGLWMTDDEGATWVDALSDIPGIGNQRGEDIRIGGDGSVVAVLGGRIVYSPTGEAETFTNVTGNGFFEAAYDRVALCRGDAAGGFDNVVHAITVEGGILEGVYRSEDGGQNWTRLLQRISDYFEPLNGQGVYDLAIECYPTDPYKLLIGGLELWGYDGGLTRLTGEGFGEFSPFYVHADKHFFYFDPNDPATVYVTSDGGVSRSEDGGVTWGVVNKGYGSIQYYGIAYSPSLDIVMGGAQDNGTSVMLGDNPNDRKVGFEVFGNDGVDCEISQISPQLFVTSQNSLTVRLDASNFNGQSELPRKEISIPYTGGDFRPDGPGPFHTRIRLWESADDPTSKDVIVFTNDTSSVTVNVGNGVKRSYAGTVKPLQSAGIPIPGSFRITTGNLGQLVEDGAGNLIGNGTGTVVYNDDETITYDFTLDNPPGLNLSIISRFAVEYEANSVLNLLSATNNLPFNHTLASALQPGDEVIIRDPVQSMLLLGLNLSTGSGFALGRGALKTGESAVDWLEFLSAGSVTCAEFSKDGNTLFVGNTGGGVIRYSGLNDLYAFEDIGAVEATRTPMSVPGNGGITGLAIDFNDANKLVVVRGGYGQNNGYVSYSGNALSNTPTFQDKQGDLPPMPVYDAEIDVNDPGIVLLATEFGVWATRDITSNNPEWTDENLAGGGWSYVPVYDIRQQKLGFGLSDNFFQYYIGTHGRGIWQSGTLASVGIDGPEHGDYLSGDFVSDLTVYPNPLQNQGTIAFDLERNGMGHVRIFDLHGRMVKDFGNRSFTKGKNNLNFYANGLGIGTYLATFEGQGVSKLTKFIVVK